MRLGERRSAIATSGFIVLASVVAIANAPDDFSARWTFLPVLSLLQLAATGALYFQLERREKRSTGPWLPHRWPEARALVVGFCALALAFAVILGLTQRASYALFFSWQQVTQLLFYYLVLIGFAEELLFRGLCFKGFPRRAWSAVLVSSALFSLYHWHSGLVSLPYYLAFGLLFGTLRRFGFPIVLLAAAHGLFDLALALWPVSRFRFGAAAFYSVAPATLLCITVLAAWMLTVLEARAPAIRRTEIWGGDKE